MQAPIEVVVRRIPVRGITVIGGSAQSKPTSPRQVNAELSRNPKPKLNCQQLDYPHRWSGEEAAEHYLARLEEQIRLTQEKIRAWSSDLFIFRDGNGNGSGGLCCLHRSVTGGHFGGGYTHICIYRISHLR